MPELPQVPPPPAIGNCVTTTQFAQPGLSPSETAHQLIRSGDGKIRVDTGNISLITDPTAQKTILLDHLNQEAKIISMAPPQPPGLQVPGMPQLTPPGLPAGMPALSGSSVQDLGKKFIEGEEAEGRRITFQPPQMPGMPGMPSLPQQPRLPGAPPLPQSPQIPTVTEIWTNPNLNLPVLTQVQGAFGQQICKCKNQTIPEPDPSLFQIPKNYTDVTPPSVPSIPSVPSAPSIPKVPTVPSFGQSR